jgi:hypothetical protein
MEDRPDPSVPLLSTRDLAVGHDGVQAELDGAGVHLTDRGALRLTP